MHCSEQVAPRPPSVDGAKGLTPVPNRLVGHSDTPLGQQVFCIAKTQAKAMVEPDGVADDLRRESIAVVGRRLAGHRPTLPATAST